MDCYACGGEAGRQCPRCGRWFCGGHGREQCNSCRAPGSLPPPARLFNLALVLLVVSVGLAVWHLAAWPEFPAPPPRFPAGAAQTSGQLPAATAIPAGTRATPAASADQRRYKVSEGDTLSGVAARFDTTVDAIARANNLADPEALQIGQELVIP